MREFSRESKYGGEIIPPHFRDKALVTILSTFFFSNNDFSTEYRLELIEFAENLLVGRLRKSVKKSVIKVDWVALGLLMIAVAKHVKRLPFEVVELLVKTEVGIGGPYKQGSGEINLISNIIIFCMLKCYEIHLPDLYKWIIERLESKNRSFSAFELMIEAIFRKLTNCIEGQDHIIDVPSDSMYSGKMSSYDRACLKISYLLIGNKQRCEFLDQKEKEINPLVDFVLGITNGQSDININDNREYYKKVIYTFKKQFEKVKFPKGFLSNSFTNESIMLPKYLENMVTFPSQKVQISISHMNLLGWMVFINLDAENDGHKLFKFGISDKELFEKYRSLMIKMVHSSKRVDKFLDKILRLNNSNNNVSDKNVIERSSIYYYVIKGLFPTKVKLFKALDKYILAKQYLDDLHDFVEDLQYDRKTLITCKYRSLEEYTVSLDKEVEEIRRIIDSAKETLTSFLPLDKLETSIEEYYYAKSLANI